jgi:hypothetical protein
VAAPREQRDRDAPHPARRTRDEHLAVTGPHAVALEDEDRERRGVPRAAERHRLPLIERRRQWQEEVAVDARALAEPTPARLAAPPPVQDDAVSGFPRRVIAALHDAGEVDARDHRVPARDRRASGEGEPVLVVDRGVRDADEHVAVHELRVVDVADADDLPAAGLLDPQCSEHALLLGRREVRPTEGGPESARSTWKEPASC